MKEYIIPKIEVKKASITTLRVDAIVNPANSFGYMGGEVAEAIKKVGGQSIEEEAIEQAPIQVGEAIVTGAGDLLCHKIIHAPTMHNPVEKTDSYKIKWAIEAALDIANREKFKTIAIPGMGTGVGKFDKNESAQIIVSTIRETKFEILERIYLVDINDEMVEAFNDAVNNFGKAGKKKK